MARRSLFLKTSMKVKCSLEKTDVTWEWIDSTTNAANELPITANYDVMCSEGRMTIFPIDHYFYIVQEFLCSLPKSLSAYALCEWVIVQVTQTSGLKKKSTEQKKLVSHIASRITAQLPNKMIKSSIPSCFLPTSPALSTLFTLSFFLSFPSFHVQYLLIIQGSASLTKKPPLMVSGPFL